MDRRDLAQPDLRQPLDQAEPGFSSVAVISLALGIGANLAVFGVLHRLVLSTLPVRDPGSFVSRGRETAGADGL